VDFICIDQGNISERIIQVSVMKWIYGNATSVLIWLGEQEKGHEPYWESLIFGLKNRSHPFNYFGTIHQAVMSSVVIRPYWEILWVIQEFCVAK
ncbi:hypothetical protein B0J14DRAFT_429351, partial [Halenospora varia]